MVDVNKKRRAFGVVCVVWCGVVGGMGWCGVARVGQGSGSRAGRQQGGRGAAQHQQGRGEEGGGGTGQQDRSGASNSWHQRPGQRSHSLDHIAFGHVITYQMLISAQELLHHVTSPHVTFKNFSKL